MNIKSRPAGKVAAQQYAQRDYSGAEESLAEVMDVLKGEMKADA